MGLPDSEESLTIIWAISSFNTIPACDGQTDSRQCSDVRQWCYLASHSCDVIPLSDVIALSLTAVKDDRQPCALSIVDDKHWYILQYYTHSMAYLIFMTAMSGQRSGLLGKRKFITRMHITDLWTDIQYKYNL